MAYKSFNTYNEKILKTNFVTFYSPKMLLKKESKSRISSLLILDLKTKSKKFLI